ncbi:hypothetical protein D3C73_1235950 [compost metagenome]
MLLPLTDHIFILAEHPFPGAWRINDNFIEKMRERFRDALRCLIQHNRVSHTVQLYIFSQRFRSICADVVCNQYALTLQLACNLR